MRHQIAIVETARKDATAIVKKGIYGGAIGVAGYFTFQLVSSFASSIGSTVQSGLLYGLTAAQRLLLLSSDESPAPLQPIGTRTETTDSQQSETGTTPLAFTLLGWGVTLWAGLHLVAKINALI